MPSVESLTFELGDCELRQQNETERSWISSDHVAHHLKFTRGIIRWPFDLTDLSSARQFYRRECEQNAGAMLEMDVVTAAGAEGLSGVFKYRSPMPGSLGKAYVGILWLPFEDCRFQVNVEALELGITGSRESAVLLLEGDRWPMEPQEEIPVLETMEQWHELSRKTRIRQLPSDDPKYDASFPEHPLSLVRTRLARIIGSARLGSDAKDLRPHRIRGASRG
ncbi:MAG TPA: hypothetical protein VG055_14895 [Planctomycetaceae bacterium]|jgi:hypothetical protein|nr:hypothetical protein [Planctomycetaceae bacterium]